MNCLKGELDPTVMVTHRFSFSDVDKVYPLFDERDEKDAIQKVFLETRFSAPAAAGTPKLVIFQNRGNEKLMFAVVSCAKMVIQAL